MVQPGRKYSSNLATPSRRRSAPIRPTRTFVHSYRSTHAEPLIQLLPAGLKFLHAPISIWREDLLGELRHVAREVLSIRPNPCRYLEPRHEQGLPIQRRHTRWLVLLQYLYKKHQQDLNFYKMPTIHSPELSGHPFEFAGHLEFSVVLLSGCREF